MNFLGINWSVRIKNPNFWVKVVLSIVTPVMAYFGLTAADFTTWPMVWETIVSAVQNPYVIVTVLVSLFNSVVDSTSTGLTDSELALSYVEPNKK